MRLLILLVALSTLFQGRLTSIDCPLNDPRCGETVQVGLYYESLCPYSRAFVLNQLWPTFNKLSKADPPILTVNLVPFGNAHLTFYPNSTKEPRLNFTCQHNQPECDGNLIQSCSVVKLGAAKSVALVNCMFNSTYWKTPFDSAAQCAKQLNLDYNALSTCANSVEGLAYEYLMAGETQALRPAHQGVPWVTINGAHTNDIQNRAQTNLLKLVCDSYKQLPKPQPCNSA